MLRRFIFAAYERQLNRTYRNRLASQGSTARGVFWKSELSQIARFHALLTLVRKLKPTAPISIADIGCGYGAMFDFIMSSPEFLYIDYHGVDINRDMIRASHRKFPQQSHLFSISNRPDKIVDFCLFSGTFNLTYSDNPALWTDYIFSWLDKCMAQTRCGLVLNLLCAPETKIQKQIFYANRAIFIARAKAHFGAIHAQSTKHVTDDVSFLITHKSQSSLT